MHTFGPFDGALLIDKPVGPTSHDVVDTVRNYLGIKKAGHCGTLDPNATGLVIIVLGRATKLAEKLMSDDKVYSGILKLGETTSSYDAEGELTGSHPLPSLTLDDLNRLAETFLGDQMQLPPMVSAVKKGGVPLYKLARKGLEVERKPRLVHVYQFRFTDYQPPHAFFRIACTKGTYVRSLVHDLGEKAGCGAYLAYLRRLSSGRFDVDHALEMESLITQPAKELEQHIIPYLKLAS